MRFASITPRPEPQRQAATEFIRKLVLPQQPAAAQPEEPVKGFFELPLDQRIRLVGEW